MKSIKAWLRRWLEAVSESELAVLREAGDQRMRRFSADHETALSTLKAEHESTIASLIQELNTLRNSIPSAVAQNTNSQVRVLRNFREFRTTVEHRPAKKGTA